MAWVAWNETYRVGDARLDCDHRILIDLLDQLYDAMETGQSRDVVGSVVSVLAEYAGHHFAREEAILAAAGFPDLGRHREEHRALYRRVAEVRDRYRQAERGVLGQDVVDLLRNWLTEHILVSDNSYKPWVERVDSDGSNPSEMAERGCIQS